MYTVTYKKTSNGTPNTAKVIAKSQEHAAFIIAHLGYIVICAK